MKLYKSLTTLLLFFFSITVQAQVYYPMSFSIVDKSGNPIKEVRVSIKELGYQSGISGSDGKIFFQDVPVGEIHYFVAREGYNGADGAFNITTISKNNTLRIILAKKPTQKATMMLISGEVIDEDGNDVNGAKVEIRAGRSIQNVITDESGNFNIDINLDEIENGVTEFLLEVTKNDCKKKDKFVIPKNKYLYKEVVIKCSERVVPSVICEKKIGDWDFKLTGCERNGNSITCNFEIKSNYRDRNFRINYPSSTLYDNFGNEYHVSTAKLGDKEGRSASKLLIANITIPGNVIFENISTQATEISVIDFIVNGDDLSIKKIHCRDIPIK